MCRSVLMPLVNCYKCYNGKKWHACGLVLSYELRLRLLGLSLDFTLLQVCAAKVWKLPWPAGHRLH